VEVEHRAAFLQHPLGAAIGYEVYSWQLQLWPVVVMNGVFLVLVAIEIVLKAIYDRRNRATS
jgi:hypothetical protein